MKLGILFSGGKDSNYAMFKASQEHEITCLISLISKNSESYMFQTPGNNFLKAQAKALGLPLIEIKTKGEKEKELKDLKKGILIAKKKYNIEGVVSGAIKSNYQSLRIQKICNELNLWLFNPLWQINEREYLNELLKSKFEIFILAIASYPFTKNTLGKLIDKKMKNELLEISDKYKISPVGEGGEFESFVLDSPLFKHKLEIKKSEKIMESENCGFIHIEEIIEIKKQEKLLRN